MTAAFDRFGQNQTLWSPSQQPPSDRSKLLGPQQLRQATRSIEAASTQPISVNAARMAFSLSAGGQYQPVVVMSRSKPWHQCVAAVLGRAA